MILGIYAAMRVGLWIRGQYRLALGSASLPALPRALLPPAHLNPELVRFFEECVQTHAALTQQRRLIAKARVCDPDQCFGFLRDPRYRRAVIEAAGIIRGWMRRTEACFGQGRPQRREWPVSPECAQSTLLSIDPQLRLAKHSRALEPFALQDVQRLDRSLASFLNKLEQTLEYLENKSAVSYRVPPRATPRGPELWMAKASAPR